MTQAGRLVAAALLSGLLNCLHLLSICCPCLCDLNEGDFPFPGFKRNGTFLALWYTDYYSVCLLRGCEKESGLGRGQFNCDVQLPEVPLSTLASPEPNQFSMAKLGLVSTPVPVRKFLRPVC